jgi:hypothetical protein
MLALYPMEHVFGGNTLVYSKSLDENAMKLLFD